MRRPAIKELPQPPSGATGWPWDVESRPVADRMPDGCPWPKIAIVTPSLNQGQFIEKTIRSVLLQGYPDLEYIIMDGGSTDGSCEIIKRYEKWLTHWQSAPDRGQSNAINMGFALAQGNILAWLNSDDHYCPNALSQVAESAAHQKNFSAIVGACRQVDEVYGRTSLILPRRLTRQDIVPWYFGENQIAQPSCFMMAWAVKKAGPFREDLHYVFDYEYWLRLLEFGPFYKLEKCLSEILVHPGVKPLQNPGKAFAELIRVMFEKGHQDVACSILETAWDRKHQMETLVRSLKSKLPRPVTGVIIRWFKRLKWL
jgi:glycosyltransferase involved in cell wall biosynthesis